MSASREINNTPPELDFKGFSFTGVPKKLELASFLPELEKRVHLFRKTGNKKYLQLSYMVDTPPEQPQTHHRARVTKQRASYIPPSREGKVSVVAHVAPELKEAVNKVADESGLTINEFLTLALQQAVKGHSAQIDALTEKMTQEALEKTRVAEKALNRMSVNFSTHSR